MARAGAAAGNTGVGVGRIATEEPCKTAGCWFTALDAASPTGANALADGSVAVLEICVVVCALREPVKTVSAKRK